MRLLLLFRKRMVKTIPALFLVTLFSGSLHAQLPYSWTSGVNPGWVSSNSSVNTLSWQPNLGAVSTSDLIAPSGTASYTYNNSQVTSYTSPVYNFTGCSTSAFVRVTVSMYVDLENRYDWLYFQYSINGGTTWINPVALSASNNLSGVNLSGFPPLTAWANNASNRNGWTNYLGVISPQYLIPKTANRFRFVFASDVSGNSSFGIVYSADIIGFSVVCPVVLPVDISDFTGQKVTGGNLLAWTVENERPGVTYVVEKSTDGYDWESLGSVEGKLLSAYQLFDDSPANIVNYYRLHYVDSDGTIVDFDKMVAIDNTIKKGEIESVVNALGQIVAVDTPGLVIIHYTNGETLKVYNP